MLKTDPFTPEDPPDWIVLCKCHCDTESVAAINYILIPYRAAGLSYIFYTALSRTLNIISEWEKCVTSERNTGNL